MDFVARAGAIIDRAHRVAGILLLCVLVLCLVSMCQLVENQNLQAEMNMQRIRYPVIVVPDATTGVYSPTEEDRLIYLFADFVTQSLNSYTPANIAKLYKGIYPYMGPAMQTDSQPYFERKIRDSTSDRRSSFFVPDRTILPEVKKRRENGVEFRDVNVRGEIRTIVGGTLAEGSPMEIQMTFQKVFASPANPYGFLLTKYYEKLLLDPLQAPKLPSAAAGNL
jgi:hypothetical protein